VIASESGTIRELSGPPESLSLFWESETLPSVDLYEIGVVTEFGNYLATMHVIEPVTMVLKKAFALGFLSRAEPIRFKFEVIEDLTSEWRLVHFFLR